MESTGPELSGAAMAGAGLGQLVAWAGGLACVVIGVIVGVKILKKQGTGLGVTAILLAIFCVLPTFIWGWIKAKELDIKGLMLGYTVAVIVWIGGIIVAVGSITGGVMEAMDDPAMQQMIEEAAAEAAAAQEAANQ